MHNITVHRKTRFFRWQRHKRYVRQLPENWGEIRPALVAAIVKINSQHHWQKAQLLILQRLLNLPKGVFFTLTDLEVAELARCIQWIQELPAPKAIIQDIYYRGQLYSFPKEKFSNGTAFEYPVISEYLDDFIETGQQDLLHKLAAVLLRPVARDKEKSRLPAKSRGEVELMAKHFADLPKYVLAIALQYAIGITHYVHRTYGQWLFAAADPQEEEEQGPKGPNFGWWGVYMDIAESGVFGTYDQVLSSSFHVICTYLVKRKQSALEQRNSNSNAEQI